MRADVTDCAQDILEGIGVAVFFESALQDKGRNTERVEPLSISHAFPFPRKSGVSATWAHNHGGAVGPIDAGRKVSEAGFVHDAVATIREFFGFDSSFLTGNPFRP